MSPRPVPQVTVLPSSLSPVAEIPRVAFSSHDALLKTIDAATPAVLTTGLTRKGVERLVSPQDLRRAFGGDQVTVSISHRGSFRPKAGTEIAGTRMPFADFATYVENPGQSADRLYLSQFPLDSGRLNLGIDVDPPSYLQENFAPVSTNLWFGPAGTISPFHFDRSHNIFHQHWGRKHVVMVDPSCLDALRPGDKNSGTPHVSSLDLVPSGFDIDLSRLRVPCLQAMLEAGDALFIPAFWWHHVLAVDAAVSVNYWWRPPMSACLYPSFFRMLSSRSVFRDPSVVSHWVDVAPHRIDTSLCLFLADEGHTFGAAALAGAIATAFCTKALRVLGVPEADVPMHEAGAGSMPDFGHAATVIPALTAHGVIDSSQSNLLLRWVELAEGIAAEPAPRVYSPQRTAVLRDMIWRLHVELGTWLAM